MSRSARRLPYIKAKDQVIIPKHSRNPYDVGVRMVGAEIVEVETPEELRAKISARTAMIYVMSDPRRPRKARCSIPAIIAIAKEKNMPVLVDAAAEEPLNPNLASVSAAPPWSAIPAANACAGRNPPACCWATRNLCKAAYFQAAPHHVYGRALKCSKEETMGLLAAVTQWYKRDHAAEQKMWRGWMQHYRNAAEAAAFHQFRISGAAGPFQQGDAAARPLGRRMCWASPAPNW